MRKPEEDAAATRLMALADAWNDTVEALIELEPGNRREVLRRSSWSVEVQALLLADAALDEENNP